MSHLSIKDAISFVEHRGYALLFFWVLAEQGAVPIPSAPLLIAVGALIRTGRLHPVAAVACCVAGSLVADSVWFYFGRHRGKRVLRFICRVSLEPDSCVRQTENAFLKYGLNTLLFAKFIPGLNAVAAPLVGDSGIGILRFLTADAVGIVIWSGAYMGVGYVFSQQLELALDYVEQLGSDVVLVVVGLIVGWILWKFIQRRVFLKRLAMARISPEELYERMEAHEDLYIVDLRSEREEKTIVVPGAVHFSAEALKADSQPIPRDREIIVLCSCPDEASAARMALFLRSQGITRVRPLRGGAEAWGKMMQLRG